MIARLAFEPARTSTQRCTIPSPPQANTSSAPSSSARRTCAGALRLFGTSHQSGSSTPSASSTRRSSASPPPSVLPAWAITATFMLPAPVRGAGAGGAAGEHDHDQRGDARPRTPPATSSGWCMPRYIRDVATNATIATTSVQATVRKTRFVNRRGEQQREPAVDGQRGGGVAGWVAGVDRQVLEAERRAAGASARRASWRDRSPTRRPARRRRTPRSATSCKTTLTRATTPTTIGRTTPPATIEPISDACVRRASGARRATC